MSTIIRTDVPANVTEYSNSRKIVRLSDGTLYAVYPRGVIKKLYSKKSVDNGKTWTDETLISTYAGMSDYDQQHASLAVDGNDDLHVVWTGRATGFTLFRQVWYAKYTGVWSANVRISTYAGMSSYSQDNPSLAVTSNDNLHVVWGGKATGFTTANQIWYAKYVVSWSTPVRISTYANMSTNNQFGPCIATTSDDNLHVVWGGKATGFTTDEQVWYAKYTGSWVAPVRISTYPNMQNHDQYFPSIAVDTSDYLHVSWYGRSAEFPGVYKVFYVAYVGSWGTPKFIQAVNENQYVNMRWSRYPACNIPAPPTKAYTNRVDYVFTSSASPHVMRFDYIFSVKVIGVSNPGKINGILITNIAKVTGMVITD